MPGSRDGVGPPGPTAARRPLALSSVADLAVLAGTLVTAAGLAAARPLAGQDATDPPTHDHTTATPEETTMFDRDHEWNAGPTDPAAVPDVTHPDTATRLKAIAVEIRDSPADARDELLFARMVAAWPTLEAQSN